jgi:hypothetical protein
MSPSVDDAALFGKNVLQVIIDASPIGLPIAGLAAAFALSKSGIQQREDLRTEVEQVQTNIIKKSEEAAIAGKASQVSKHEKNFEFSFNYSMLPLTFLLIDNIRHSWRYQSCRHC